jgi:PadR family transcriptional regulator, regulatory protein PadR
MKKGVLEYCVLSLVATQWRYGFELVELLGSVDGLLITEGTIYPLLSRMRADGLVDTEWRESEEGRPRRYYRISPAGKAALKDFQVEWEKFRTAVDTMLRTGKGGAIR